MKKKIIKKLEKQGWKVGSVTDFLQLSHEEEEYIEMKLAKQDVMPQLTTLPYSHLDLC